MSQFKRVMPLVQLTFSLVSLVGCTSVVTLPLTSIPFFVVGLAVLFLPADMSWLRTSWYYLQWILSFQALVFAISLAYTFMTEVSDVWQGVFHVMTRFEPEHSDEDRQRLRRQAEYRHLGIGGMTVLVAAVPAVCLILGLLLWRSGDETVGTILALLGAALISVLLVLWYKIVATKESPYRRYW